MKYRARVTNVKPIARAVYQLDDWQFLTDKADTWIEVDTEEEAVEIERMNAAQGVKEDAYNALLDIVSAKSQEPGKEGGRR